MISKTYEDHLTQLDRKCVPQNTKFCFSFISRSLSRNVFSATKKLYLLQHAVIILITYKLQRQNSKHFFLGRKHALRTWLQTAILLPLLLPPLLLLLLPIYQAPRLKHTLKAVSMSCKLLVIKAHKISLCVVVRGENPKSNILKLLNINEHVKLQAKLASYKYLLLNVWALFTYLLGLSITFQLLNTSNLNSRICTTMLLPPCRR